MNRVAITITADLDLMQLVGMEGPMSSNPKLTANILRAALRSTLRGVKESGVIAILPEGTPIPTHQLMIEGFTPPEVGGIIDAWGAKEGVRMMEEVMQSNRSICSHEVTSTQLEAPLG
jgi:hypothetical protein